MVFLTKYKYVIVSILIVIQFMAGYRLQDYNHKVYLLEQSEATNELNKKIHKEQLIISEEYEKKKDNNNKRRNEVITTDTSKDNLSEDSIDFINR